MVLAVEIIVCCLIFGIYRVIRIKRDPAYKISNMPEKLQKKVMHMRGYRNRNIRIMTDWEKFVKKLPTLIFWTIALVILTSIAGATSFSTGFVFALLIWMAVLLFLELVVYCGWYAHTPKVWYRGYGEKDIYQLCTLYRADTTESFDGNSGCYYSGSCDRYDSKA